MHQRTGVRLPFATPAEISRSQTSLRPEVRLTAI